jgi:hypothetical protein
VAGTPGTWAAPTGSGGSSLVPTAIKSANYNAAVSDLVLANASSSWTVTLPTTPANKSQVGVAMVAQTGTDVISVTAGGSDVINSNGSTGVSTLTVGTLNQIIILQYDSTLTSWYQLTNSLTLASGSALSLILNYNITGPPETGIAGTALLAQNNPTILAPANPVVTAAAITTSGSGPYTWTVTFQSPGHGLPVGSSGQPLGLYGWTPSGFNSTLFFGGLSVASVPDATHLTITAATNPGTGGGNVTAVGQVVFDPLFSTTGEGYQSLSGFARGIVAIESVTLWGVPVSPIQTGGTGLSHFPIAANTPVTQSGWQCTNGNSTLTQQTGTAASAGIVEGMRIFMQDVPAETVVSQVSTNVSTGTSTISMINSMTGNAVNATGSSGGSGFTACFSQDFTPPLGAEFVPGATTQYPTSFPEAATYNPASGIATGAAGVYIRNRITGSDCCTVAACTVTAGSNSITSSNNFITSGVAYGHLVRGSGPAYGALFPPGTTVTSVASGTITVSNNANTNASGIFSLVFTGNFSNINGYDLQVHSEVGGTGENWFHVALVGIGEGAANSFGSDGLPNFTNFYGLTLGPIQSDGSTILPYTAGTNNAGLLNASTTVYPSAPPYANIVSLPLMPVVSSISGTGSVVTIVFASAPAIANGQTFTLSGSSTAAYNTTYTVTSGGGTATIVCSGTGTGTPSTLPIGTYIGFTSLTITASTTTMFPASGTVQVGNTQVHAGTIPYNSFTYSSLSGSTFVGCTSTSNIVILPGNQLWSSVNYWTLASTNFTLPTPLSTTQLITAAANSTATAGGIAAGFFEGQQVTYINLNTSTITFSRDATAGLGVKLGAATRALTNGGYISFRWTVNATNSTSYWQETGFLTSAAL